MKTTREDGTHLCSGPQRHAWPNANDAEHCCNGYRRVGSYEKTEDGSYRVVFSWEALHSHEPESDASATPDIVTTENPDNVPRPQLVSERQPPTDPNKPVSHAAFFTALSELPEKSFDFQMLSAALLVLRLLDRWLVRATTARAIEFQEFIRVKRKVESLDDGPYRRVLGELVNTISAFAYGTGDSRIPKLIVFAQLLENDSHWGPAADLYATTIELIGSRPQDRDLLPMCYDRQGFCRRQLRGPYEGVADLYNEGIAVAREMEDAATREDDRVAALGWALRLRISNAVFEFEKGNLPEAEYQLDVIIEDAKIAQLADLIARATHERGQVAYRRDQDELAATLFYRAAQTHTDPRMARRAELDLAAALSDLGHIERARKICEIVRNRRDHAGLDQRPLAGINLLRLAHMRGDRRAFDRLREELSTENMSGRLRAIYHLTVGQGLRRFGEIQEARSAFYQTIEIAQDFRVYQLVIRAETLLRASENDQPKPHRTPRETPELAPIFDAIDNRIGPFAEAAM